MGSVGRDARALLSLLVLVCATPAFSAVCSVPSASHPTIQAAVEDLACTEIVVAAGSFVESVEIARSLEISGDSSTTTVIEGRVSASGAGVEVTINDLKVDAGAPSAAGCFPVAVDIGGGASLVSSNLVAINAAGDACLLFADGFETGNTGAWSATSP